MYYPSSENSYCEAFLRLCFAYADFWFSYVAAQILKWNLRRAVEKLGCTGVNILLILNPKHRLEINN